MLGSLLVGRIVSVLLCKVKWRCDYGISAVVNCQTIAGVTLACSIAAFDVGLLWHPEPLGGRKLRTLLSMLLGNIGPRWRLPTKFH